MSFIIKYVYVVALATILIFLITVYFAENFKVGRNFLDSSPVTPPGSKYASLDACTFNSRRTGNLMFALAGLLFVAQNTRRNPILPTNIPYGWMDDYFNTSSIQRLPNEFVYDANKTVVLKERFGPFVYDPIFENPHKNSTVESKEIILLCGYFQNYKYVEKIDKKLKMIFTFYNETQSKVQNFIDHHKKTSAKNRSNVATVGIHIRRGDFLIKFHRNRGFAVVDENFINSTVNYFYKLWTAKNVEFILYFIASEDEAWVNSVVKKLNFARALNKAAFVFSTSNGGPFDMCLISMCDGVITSSGSFSWWAGWLANTTTIYFTGYPRKGSALGEGFDRKTYQKPDWIGFPPEI
ncbi:hypothetical protein HELRODRAFT_173990 [Helobdella robusta]|uniref:L-Fucosyltransferase n=1 Tax=Helobdella robusta TaxID=6412 RepID=T1F7G4_HELRO|nr:hypothetical protein HELRODRAFT_173990 [Helobdella robusta]ESO03106.1 hypothetical protein HELRODRAFT_173990 [Helobdella robusta]